MNTATRVAVLFLGSALGIPAVQAATATTTSTYDLHIGATAPAGYRNTNIISNWQALGLTEPEAGTHWVKIGDRYVKVRDDDGTIQAVKPTVK